MARTASKLDWLRSRPDLQTEEGSRWLSYLERNHGHADPLMPWLTREWKKGRLFNNHNFINHPGYATGEADPENLNYRELHPGTTQHWMDWYDSSHPTRQGVDIGSKAFQVPQMLESVNTWDEDMARRAEEAKLQEQNDAPVLHQWPDGWKLQRLLPKHLEYEGETMGHCFVPGTLIRTAEGLCPIETIRKGDLVLADDGHYNSVTETFVHQHHGKVYQVTLPTDVEPIVVTGEHPFLTSEGWITAENLVVDQYIATATFANHQDFEVLRVPEQYSSTVPGRWGGRLGPTEFELTDELLWLIGLYLAEGNADGDKIQYSLSKDEESYADRVRAYFGAHGFTVRVDKRPESYGGLVLKFNSRMLSEWWREWLGSGCSAKAIPPELMNLPDERLAILLEGLMDGDGHRPDDLLRQTSPILAAQVVEISLRLGGSPYMSVQHQSGRRPCYNVYGATGPRQDQRERYSGGHARVLDVTSEAYSGPVYNIEVEDRHTYVVNGVVVHNCVGGYGYGDQVRHGNTAILSLRDPNGRPHVTAELEPDERRAGEADWPELPPFDINRAIERNPVTKATPDHIKEGLRQLHDEVGDLDPYERNERLKQTYPLPVSGTDLGALYQELHHQHSGAVQTPLENARIVQMQGRGNEVPKPEYQQRMKDWFQTFPEEARPNWEYPDRPIDHIGGIVPDARSYEEGNRGGWGARYNEIEGEPGLNDEEEWAEGGYGPHGDYGLVPPKRPINYLETMKSLVRPQSYEDMEYGHRTYEPVEAKGLYQEALRRGEIPEMGAAFQPFAEHAMDQFNRAQDYEMMYNPEYPHYPGESWDEEPERWQNQTDEYGEQVDPQEAWRAERDKYDEAEEDLANNHPWFRAENDLYKWLQPHMDPEGKYPNAPEGQDYTDPATRAAQMNFQPNVGSPRAFIKDLAVGAQYMDDEGMHHTVTQTDPLRVDGRSPGWRSNWQSTVPRFIKPPPQTPGTFSKKAGTFLHHYNTWTGKRCYCPWGKRRPSNRRLAGQALNKLLKSPDKRLNAPEGQQFMESLKDMLLEHPDADGLAPWLAQRWKKGDFRYHPGSGKLYYPAYLNQPWEDETPDYGWNRVEASLPEWSRWYEARQHPTRRGVNVMDPNFNVHTMSAKAQEHRQALERQRQVEEDLSYGDVVKRWPDGWHIRHLNSDSYQSRYALEGEGDAMGHCIGSHQQPYQDMAENGHIGVFSLRDKNGWPHATWHTNNNYGGVAEVFGREDSHLKPEYQDRYEEWCRDHNVDPDPVGNMEEEEDRGDPEIHLPDPDSVETYLGQYHENSSPYEIAEQYGNLGEDTDVIPGDPNHPDIAWDLYQRPSVGYNYPNRRRNTEDETLQEVWNTAGQQHHLPALHDEMMDYEPGTPEEEAVKRQWRSLAQGHNNDVAEGRSPIPYGFNGTLPLPEIQHEWQFPHPWSWEQQPANPPEGQSQLFSAFLDDARHYAGSSPLYYRWVFSPVTGDVDLSNNAEDDPKLHGELAKQRNEPGLVHGYAYRIGGGWRLTDWESKPLADPYVVAQVMRRLRDAEGYRPADNASQDWSEPEDFSRIHHGIPAS